MWFGLPIQGLGRLLGDQETARGRDSRSDPNHNLLPESRVPD